MRQMLSYLASAQGQFGYVDRYGKYVRKWYGQPVKTLDNNTIDLPTLSERQNVIVGIICKVSDDETLSLGVTDTTQGRVLEFENPYKTESLLQSLWRRIGGSVSYTHLKYTIDTLLAAMIYDKLAWLQWAKTKDGARGINMYRPRG